jgi:hypothetical protein
MGQSGKVFWGRWVQRKMLKKKKKTAGGGEQNIDYQMREEQCSKWGK